MKNNAFSLPLIALAGFIAGILVYSVDSDQFLSAPYSPKYSYFLKAGDAYIRDVSIKSSVLTLEESMSPVWFFRKYPGFLIWSLMHIIGVALCFILFGEVLVQIQKIKKMVNQFSKKLFLAIVIVLSILLPLLALVYKFAYSFDYVAFLMPLKNANLKIYTFEGLNYFTGASCLVVMTLVSLSLSGPGAKSCTPETKAKLQECFISCLYIVALVIGYSTLAGGQLYKSLNYFYKDISGNNSGALYFPNEIIYALGLFNSFILAVFFLPALQLRMKPGKIIKTKDAETAPMNIKSYFSINGPFVEDIKMLLAILTPLFAAIFSASV